MKVDMSKEGVWLRIEEVARCSNLETSRRLETKVDLSPAAVSRRIEEVEQLRRLCLSLRPKHR